MAKRGSAIGDLMAAIPKRGPMHLDEAPRQGRDQIGFSQHAEGESQIRTACGARLNENS
ncbi:hypothetical protein LJR220_005631 [Bradyrhizobium sp. LjRoot220]|uniref:hypothetical protein n=1 Tax=Bradyrhizobium sp. LjRoot220 TaxID=3342284 RepID=UPI003ED147A3